LSVVDCGHDWRLINLDCAFEYKGRRHSCVVVRSRWHGYPLGGDEPTSVVVLLIDDCAIADRAGLQATDCELAAWGMVEVETVKS